MSQTTSEIKIEPKIATDSKTENNIEIFQELELYQELDKEPKRNWN